MINNFKFKVPYKATISWLDKYLINPHNVVNRDAYIHEWINRVEKWISTRGPKDTVSRVKAIRLHTTKYLCGEALLTPLHPSIGLNKKGLPRNLGSLQNLIHSNNPEDIRLLMTLLSISRSLDCPPKEPSLVEITSPAPEVSKELIRDITYIINDLGMTLEVPYWTSSHLSTKAGPNAQAMISSIMDLSLLPERLRRSIGVFGGEDLLNRMTLLDAVDPQKWLAKYGYKSRGLIRRLSLIPSPEGKNRVIAILDYWSQTALKPLHESIFDLLRCIKGDCTFDQGGHRKSLSRTGPFHSLDLSSATDRFPIALQTKVLEVLIGEERAKAWEDILIGYEFIPNWDPTPVKYGAGQPMGAYSSWAVFSLCHHLTVRVAALRAGLGPRWSNYALLGDDIVLGDTRVATQYKLIMAELGVSLSSEKSHTSENMYEFAKRWVRDGVEVSGIPLNGFKTTKWYLIAEELRNAASRCAIQPHELETRSVATLLPVLGILPRLHKKIRIFLNLPLSTDTKSVQDEKVERLISLFYGPSGIGCTRSGECKTSFMMQTLAEVKTMVLENAIKESHKRINQFASTLASVVEIPLGLDAQSLLMALPPIEACLSEVGRNQEDFDKLRSAYWDDDMSIVFNRVTHLAINPERVLATRGHIMVQASNATLINRYNMWSKAYLTTRSLELREPDISPDHS
jgi:hypothetical protein